MRRIDIKGNGQTLNVIDRYVYTRTLDLADESTVQPSSKAKFLLRQRLRDSTGANVVRQHVPK
ncbi:hypothetical protein Y024_5289 [Burkholderia pseudomallei TSV44]|nr:hypothetical protein Y024_5289 [Burkholderia pseudomallei TSV44]